MPEPTQPPEPSELKPGDNFVCKQCKFIWWDTNNAVRHHLDTQHPIGLYVVYPDWSKNTPPALKRRLLKKRKPENPTGLQVYTQETPESNPKSTR